MEIGTSQTADSSHTTFVLRGRVGGGPFTVGSWASLRAGERISSKQTLHPSSKTRTLGARDLCCDPSPSYIQHPEPVKTLLQRSFSGGTEQERSLIQMEMKVSAVVRPGESFLYPHQNEQPVGEPPSTGQGHSRKAKGSTDTVLGAATWLFNSSI